MMGDDAIGVALVRNAMHWTEEPAACADFVWAFEIDASRTKLNEDPSAQNVVYVLV